MRKWQNVLNSGWKSCFVQSRVLCWKPLRSSLPSGKTTKRADLGLETLSCKTSCTFLNIAKTWYAQCENDKTWWCWAQNAVLILCTNLCTLLKIAQNSCAQCENAKTCWSQAKNAVSNKLAHFAKKLLKSGVPSAKNDKSCWSRVGNADLYKPLQFAKNC